jgi:hypothetical protein
MADPILAKIVQQNGQKLLDNAVARLLPLSPTGKPGLVSKIAGAALLRVATKSVPGAIVVGGGLLAKTLYDRKKASKQPKQTPDAKAVKAGKTGKPKASRERG